MINSNNSKIIDEIRRDVDIVDVIGTYVDLKKCGKSFKGICPFHNDTNPSMMVSPEKQIFTCFSCGHTGNVFTFVKDIEKISFMEAVVKVCKLTNHKIPDGLDRPVIRQADDKYARYYQLMKDLSDYYQYQLLLGKYELANKYVESRHLDRNDYQLFNVGYSPESGLESIEHLRQKGYSDDEIISSGVGVEAGKNIIIDRLRGRVCFAIKNSDGKIVAFSGRRINDSMGEKYVNTPETVIFKKSNVLYNYHNAILESKKNGFTYIVEGFMDAIALYKAGIHTVVATMGTAFTSDHIRLLNQLRCEIRLLFDSDNPGQIATNRAIDALKDSKISLKVVKPLEDFKDIDECLYKAGLDEVNKRINILKPVLDYKIEYLGKQINTSNHEDVKKFANDAINLLASYNLDDFDKEYYLKLVADSANLPLSLIQSQYKKHSNDNFISEDFVFYEENIPYEKVVSTLNKYDRVDHHIIKILLGSNLKLQEFESMRVSLCGKEARQVVNLMFDRASKGLSNTVSDLLSEATPDVAKLIGEIDREDYPPASLAELVKIITTDYISKLEKDELERQLYEEIDINKQKELAKKLLEEKAKSLKK